MSVIIGVITAHHWIIHDGLRFTGLANIFREHIVYSLVKGIDIIKRRNGASYSEIVFAWV